MTTKKPKMSQVLTLLAVCIAAGLIWVTFKKTTGNDLNLTPIINLIVGISVIYIFYYLFRSKPTEHTLSPQKKNGDIQEPPLSQVIEPTPFAIVDHEKKWKILNLLGYTWTFILNAITVIIILHIYSITWDRFEIIVITLLVIIWVSIMGFMMTYANTTIELGGVLDDKFNHIRKILKDEPTDYETESSQEIKENIGRIRVNMYISGIFRFIIYLIAIFNLIMALI